MQKMILIPIEQYNRMVESYDKAVEELHEVRIRLSALEEQGDDVEREIKLYDLMDKYHCDMDVAEALLEDQEEEQGMIEEIPPTVSNR